MQAAQDGAATARGSVAAPNGSAAANITCCGEQGMSQNSTASRCENISAVAVRLCDEFRMRAMKLYVICVLNLSAKCRVKI